LNEEQNLPRLLGVAERNRRRNYRCRFRKHATGPVKSRGKTVPAFTFGSGLTTADQKNHAASLARFEWVLSLDRDEELSSALQSAILDWKKRKPQIPGLRNRPAHLYLGAWIKHSAGNPDFKKRLYRRDSARNSPAACTKTLRVTEAPGRLAGDLLHYTVRNFSSTKAKRRYVFRRWRREADVFRGTATAGAALCGSPLRGPFVQNFVGCAAGFWTDTGGALMRKNGCRAPCA